MTTPALSTAVDYVKAPLLYKGKVRELYDLGEHYLIVVTDRISRIRLRTGSSCTGEGQRA